MKPSPTKKCFVSTNQHHPISVLKFSYNFLPQSRRSKMGSSNSTYLSNIAICPLNHDYGRTEYNFLMLQLQPRRHGCTSQPEKSTYLPSSLKEKSSAFREYELSSFSLIKRCCLSLNSLKMLGTRNKNTIPSGSLHGHLIW